MSELYLLVFGCAVSFIAVAGGYVYVRECFLDEAQQSDGEDKAADVVEGKFRESA
jgi:hypothetical protein